MCCIIETEQKMKTYISPNKTSLKKLASNIVRKELKREREGALVIVLIGELGAGKTTFVQGVAEFLDIKRTLSSPTFVIMRETNLSKGFSGITMLYHFDWYRMKRGEDIKSLGWKDIISNPKNLVIVEWGDKFPKLLPKGAIMVNILHTIKGRKIIL